MTYSRKAPPDPRGPHVRIYTSMLNHFAWRAIDFTARAFYVDLRAELRATNNGDLATATPTMQGKGWTHPRTIARCLYQLLAVGLIAKTRQGGIGKQRRVCSLFRFTDIETMERRDKGIKASPATNDFKRFQSLEDAKRTLAERVAEMEEAARGRQYPRKSRVQKVNPIATESEPMTPNKGTETEAQRCTKVPIRNLSRSKPRDRKAIQFKNFRRVDDLYGFRQLRLQKVKGLIGSHSIGPATDLKGPR